MPWEREVYVLQLKTYLEEERAKMEAAQARR